MSSSKCIRRSVLTKRLVDAIDRGARGRLGRRLAWKLVRYYEDGSSRVWLSCMIAMGIALNAMQKRARH